MGLFAGDKALTETNPKSNFEGIPELSCLRQGPSRNEADFKV